MIIKTIPRKYLLTDIESDMILGVSNQGCHQETCHFYTVIWCSIFRFKIYLWQFYMTKILTQYLQCILFGVMKFIRWFLYICSKKMIEEVTFVRIHWWVSLEISQPGWPGVLCVQGSKTAACPTGSKIHSFRMIYFLFHVTVLTNLRRFVWKYRLFN